MAIGGSVGKYAIGGLIVIIGVSVVWSVDRGVGDEVCRGVDGEVNLSKVESVWRFMAV